MTIDEACQQFKREWQLLEDAEEAFRQVATRLLEETLKEATVELEGLRQDIANSFKEE